jgi:hypothetical protein
MNNLKSELLKEAIQYADNNIKICKNTRSTLEGIVEKSKTIFNNAILHEKTMYDIYVRMKINVQEKPDNEYLLSLLEKSLQEYDLSTGESNALSMSVLLAIQDAENADIAVSEAIKQHQRLLQIMLPEVNY